MEVIRNENLGRFEIVTEGRRSVLDYVLEEKSITFTHTGVPPELEGKGYGTALAKAGLEFAKENHLHVVPACSFIRVYIRRHPEYQDLVERD